MENNIVLNPADLAAQFVNSSSRHVFLTGKAGTGKTTFLKRIITQTYKRAVIVAPTGIAAINAGGVTIHSLFQLPFGAYVPKIVPGQQLPTGVSYNTPNTLARHFNMNRRKRNLLTSLELLIIDEVSMLRADLLDAIDFMLRSVRRNQHSFGGVQVLFIGDLYQLSPVVKNQERELLSIFYQSPFFFDALCLKDKPPIYIELEKIYRQSDQVFIDLLNNLRNNQLNKQDQDLLEKHYQFDFNPGLNDGYITLTTHNHKADQINVERLKELKKNSYFYQAKISKDFSENIYPLEKQLELKVGAQVMFIKNDITGQQRYFNGKIGVVSKLTEDIIEVLPEGDAYPIQVTHYKWENIRYTTNKHTNEVEEEVIGTFEHYPIRLAWAITIHKSQGLTFSKAVIDIGQAFAPGQIYVALSRLRSLDGLILTSYLNGRGLYIDKNVEFYARTKELQERVDLQLKRDTHLYLKDSLLDAFNFESLDKYVFNHVFSYDKHENLSAKQNYLPWAKEVQDRLVELKKHADTFQNQIIRLYPQEANQDFSAIAQRIEAAIGYFSPRIAEERHNILQHVEKIKVQKQVKEYILELVDLENIYFEQWQKIIKSKIHLEAKLSGKEIEKTEYSELLEINKHGEAVKAALTMPDLEELSYDDAIPFRKIAKSKTEKAEKKVKEDTKEVSLKLFKEGKSIAEIAKERNFNVNTIEGHLAYYIAKGELEATKLLAKQKLNKIIASIKKLETTKLNDIKEDLGNDFSFGELKIGLAAWAAEAPMD